MNEDKLISIVKPYLDSCREGDWEHALRVVKWVKILGENRKDLDLLVTSAYIHDIGWANVLPKGKVGLQMMLKYEAQANSNTPNLVRKMLEIMKFGEADINTVIRLIRAADKHASEKEDEAIIVDADSLSKLCIEHVKEKYVPSSYLEVIGMWEKEFPQRIRTQKGKALYPALLEKLKVQINFDILSDYGR